VTCATDAVDGIATTGAMASCERDPFF